MGQTFVYDRLCLCLVLGIDALNQGNSLAEDGHVALEYALNHVADRQLVPLETATLQVWIDYGRLLHA